MKFEEVVFWPTWHAPFMDAQVAALIEYQKRMHSHPYTCGTDSGHPNLVPSRKGWHCVACDYTQDWSHAHVTKEDVDESQGH